MHRGISLRSPRLGTVHLSFGDSFLSFFFFFFCSFTAAGMQIEFLCILVWGASVCVCVKERTGEKSSRVCVFFFLSFFLSFLFCRSQLHCR